MSGPFVWKRAHTAIAAAAAVVLGAGGVGAAVALNGPEPSTAPAPAAATPIPTPSAARRATPAPARPAAAAVDPLTGGKPSSNEVLAVKIENIAAARPQAGLGDADIVFTEEVEGNLTRMIGVFHTRFPTRVGPVRSARNTDVELLPLFGKPGLVYSGANSKVQRNIDKSSIKPLQRSTRDPGRVAPHNVFVNLAQVAKSAKVGQPGSIGWTFARSDPRWSAAGKQSKPSGRVGGDTMSFPYSKGRYTVLWNGKPYAGTVRTDNVVIMTTKTRPDGNADVNGARSVKSATVGSGPVALYRDGRVLKGTWKRTGVSKPLQLLDSSGLPIPLKPGHSWVLLS